MRNATVTAVVIAVLATTASRVAHAEVMDKEPTLVQTWAWALVGGGIGLAAWRVRWWLGLIAATVPAFYFIGLWQEIHDPFVGPAIRVEAGAGYVAWSYAAAVIWIALQVVGAFSRLRKR
jgi:hypothetical protein